MSAIRHHWKAFLFLTCLVAAAHPVCAQPSSPQVFDATQIQAPTALDSPWRMHAGDNPDWSRPDFDDSQWTAVDLGRSLAESLPGQPNIVWYRLHLRVLPSQTHFAIQEAALAPAFEIYINGQRSLASGSIVPYRPYTSEAKLVAPISDSEVATGSIEIAIRIVISPAEWRNATPGLAPGEITLGEQSSLENRIWLDQISQNIGTSLVHILGICVGAVGLALFVAQRRRREYLWIGLTGVFDILFIVRDSFVAFHNVPLWSMATSRLIESLWELILIGLGLSFVHFRIKPWMALIVGLASITELIGMVGGDLFLVTSFVTNITFLPILQIVFIAVPIVMIVHFRRGNREAGILILPWVAQTVLVEFEQLTYCLGQIPSLGSAATAFHDRIAEYHLGPFQFDLGNIIDTLVMASLGMILVWRSIQTSQQQTRTEGELEAARQIQQLILPETTQSIPGFAIDSVYKPAQQVGGDFYQILPDDSGGLLLIVGDVAGKGMPAAMLVAVLVGAARTLTRFTSDPGEILQEMNRRLLGRSGGGFSTCLAAHITADGEVKLANAGHLSPYLDGQEVDILGALPLGIVADPDYEVCAFQLEPGSRLTFYSDGVVEAQNKQREILGFDQARQLSMSPAQQIVQAVCDFGQEDDITVVILQRTDALVPAT